MTSPVTTCPCCGRPAGLSGAGTLFSHLPCEREAGDDLLSHLSRARRCIGSGKTPEQARQAADERAAFRASLRTGGGDERMGS